MIEKEIIKADQGLRTRVLAGICAIVIVGIVVIQWGPVLGKDWLAGVSPKDALRVLRMAGMVPFLGVLPAGYIFLRVGLRIRRDGRFPYEGARVIRDTVVVRGGKARILSLGSMGAGVFFTVMGLAGTVWVWVMFPRVFGG